MPAPRVTAEAADKFRVLHASGRSYRAIGQGHGLDWRTVKKAVETASRSHNTEHWDAVRRSVDAEWLRQHYRSLLRVAEELQDILHTDPVTVAAPTTGHDFIHQSLRARSRVLLERDEESSPSGRSALDRLVVRLLTDLYAHEPGLLSVVGSWADRWDEYQAARNLIRVQLQTSLEEAGFSAAQAGELAPELLRQVARSLHLQEPLPDPKLVGTSHRQALEFSGFQLALGDSALPQRLLEATQQVITQAANATDVNRLLAQSAELLEVAKGGDDIVDEMTLRGRPSGKCSLIPGGA